MRLDALLTRFGYCSRKESAQWIKNKRILVKGVAAGSPAQKATVDDVLIDQKPVDFPNGLYIALNKPVGCVCSRSKDEGPSVYDHIPGQWLHRKPPVTSVGRLDKDTSGLLLLSDDGQYVHHHTSPKRRIAKTYFFETGQEIPPETGELFSSGKLMLHGETTPCLPAELVLTTSKTGMLTIYEGRYHQVRRMLAAVGAPVISLQRTAIGDLKLEQLNIAPGEWVAISSSDNS